MIKIDGNPISPETLDSQFSSDKTAKKIVNIINSSNNSFNYASIDFLKFEINLRKNILHTSIELNENDVSFTTFRESTCNKDYWERTKNGGFLLKSDVKPSEAINDIFKSSSKYGTECATAIVIVYYKAVLDTIPEPLFNELFKVIFLMDWLYIDSNLGVGYVYDGKEVLPGDCVYFKNPDVDDLTPEWQGENAIYLLEDLYFGHGIGIMPSKGIIKKLNKHRKRGAEESAFLTDLIIRPDYNNLYKKYYFYNLDNGSRRSPLSFSYRDCPYYEVIKNALRP